MNIKICILSRKFGQEPVYFLPLSISKFSKINDKIMTGNRFFLCLICIYWPVFSNEILCLIHMYSLYLLVELVEGVDYDGDGQGDYQHATENI